MYTVSFGQPILFWTWEPGSFEFIQHFVHYHDTRPGGSLESLILYSVIQVMLPGISLRGFDFIQALVPPLWRGFSRGPLGSGSYCLALLTDKLKSGAAVYNVFSRMRSEGSRFTLGVWEWGCVRQTLCLCSQPSATVCASAVRLSTVATASGAVPKACQVDPCRRSYIGVCRVGVCVSGLCRRSYIGVCRVGVCVSGLCRRSYIGVCRVGVCVSGLCRRSYIGVCRVGVCVSGLCRRSYIGVCRVGVCVSGLCRRYIGLWRGRVSVSDLCRRSYIGVCRGLVCVSDLCRRK